MCTLGLAYSKLTSPATSKGLTDIYCKHSMHETLLNSIVLTYTSGEGLTKNIQSMFCDAFKSEISTFHCLLQVMTQTLDDKRSAKLGCCLHDNPTLSQAKG